MVVRGLFIGLLFIISSQIVVAEIRRDTRFYKIDRRDQSTRIMFTKKKGRQAGCHNFIKSVRIHRFNQLGFAHCSLFNEKDCATAAIVPAIREKQPEAPNTLLDQGLHWFPVSDHPRGKKLKSWSCSE